MAVHVDSCGAEPEQKEAVAPAAEASDSPEDEECHADDCATVALPDAEDAAPTADGDTLESSAPGDTLEPDSRSGISNEPEQKEAVAPAAEASDSPEDEECDADDCVTVALPDAEDAAPTADGDTLESSAPGDTLEPDSRSGISKDGASRWPDFFQWWVWRAPDAAIRDHLEWLEGGVDYSTEIIGSCQGREVGADYLTENFVPGGLLEDGSASRNDNAFVVNGSETLRDEDAAHMAPSGAPGDTLETDKRSDILQMIGLPDADNRAKIMLDQEKKDKESAKGEGEDPPAAEAGVTPHICPLTTAGMRQAMEKVRSSVASDAGSMMEFQQWNEQCGEGGPL